MSFRILFFLLIHHIIFWSFNDDISEILNFLLKHLMMLIWVGYLGLKTANIFSQLQNILNTRVHHSQLSLTYFIAFKCLTGSKRRYIRSVYFLNFEYGLSWKSQLRCWRRLAGSCQNLFFFRLRHQNVSLLISRMKLLGLESLLISFDVPFFLLMSHIFWSSIRLRFLNIVKNRRVLTLKHTFDSERWAWLFRCIGTQINTF